MPKPNNDCTNLTATVVISTADDNNVGRDNQPEFEKLMKELATGSEEAAWRIAEVYTPHILRAVRASLPSALRRKLDSLDFAQIVWASMLQRRSYLAGVKSPQQLIALLSTVARRKVADAFRHNTYQVRDIRRETSLDAPNDVGTGKSVRNTEEGLFDRGPSPSQLVGIQEKWAGLVDQLNSRDRKILRLRIQGATYPVIAEQLQVSEATVRRVVDRIINQLRA